MSDDSLLQHRGVLRGLRFARVLVWLVYAWFVLAVIILTLAFFLQLFNASPTADFTQWIYRSAERVLQPFRGIFPTAELGDQGSVVDFAVVFAIIMYGIFAMVVHSLVAWLDARVATGRHLQAGDRYSSAPPPVASPTPPAPGVVPGAQYPPTAQYPAVPPTDPGILS
jgi:uncharacterized protein YggT (Ycf19 family)